MIYTKQKLSDYRPGATGSLMDEYERAVSDLKSVLQNIGEEEYTRIADADTQNENCRSIETIMNHVVRAGHFYVNYICDSLSMDALPVDNKKFTHIEIVDELDKMLSYTNDIFDGRWEELNEQMMRVYIDTGWGVRYNIDQLMEHAIVHILRHRRQIEKFLLIMQQ